MNYHPYCPFLNPNLNETPDVPKGCIDSAILVQELLDEIGVVADRQSYHEDAGLVFEFASLDEKWRGAITCDETGIVVIEFARMFRQKSNQTRVAIAWQEAFPNRGTLCPWRECLMAALIRLRDLLIQASLPR
jgi:hypothetical protein